MMRAFPDSHQQRGATLVITLVMLVLITLFAVAAITLSNSSSKVVGNMQAKKTTDAMAQRVVDQVISEGLFAEKRLVPVLPSWKPAGYDIQVTDRHCKAFTPTLGDAQTASTIWEFDVCIRDNFTGAKSYIRQGVAVKVLKTPPPCPVSVFVPTAC
jgi:type II secretory pathway pseudopilin PulG